MSGESGEKSITIVIPAYNEAESIGTVLEEVKSTCLGVAREIIVVDDGSGDGTGEIAERAGVRVIRHKQNMGYGAALKTGINAARTKFVLTFDADGQHNATEIIRLLALADKCDMVSGSRKKFIHSDFWRMPGKWFIKSLTSYLIGRKIPDLNSGLRLYKTEMIKKYMHLCPSGFSFSATSLIALLSRGYAVEFVQIESIRRSKESKSAVSISTGLETIILILRLAVLFNPLRFFLPLSFASGLFGIAWSLKYFFIGEGMSVTALFALFTSLMMFSLGLICDQISQLRIERYE